MIRLLVLSKINLNVNHTGEKITKYRNNAGVSIENEFALKFIEEIPRISRVVKFPKTTVVGIDHP